MIAFHSPEAGQVIDSFYGRCLHYNRPKARAAFPGRRTGWSGDRDDGPGSATDRPQGLVTRIAVNEPSGRRAQHLGEDVGPSTAEAVDPAHAAAPASAGDEAGDPEAS